MGYPSILPCPTQTHTDTHTRTHSYASIPFPNNSQFCLWKYKVKYSLLPSRPKKNKRTRVATVSIATNPQASPWQHTAGGGDQQRGQWAGQQVLVQFGMRLWERMIERQKWRKLNTWQRERDLVLHCTSCSEDRIPGNKMGRREGHKKRFKWMRRM